MTTLHPRSTASTADEQRVALAAPVADPLWFLARQWQTGALRADDGGDPVRVELGSVSAPLSLATGVPVSQPTVEAGPPVPAADLDTASRVHLSAELFRLMADHDVAAATVTTLRASLAAAYPLFPVIAGSTATPAAGRLPDGAALLAALASAPAPAKGRVPRVPGLGPARAPDVAAAVEDWRAWATAQLACLPTTVDLPPATWDATHLRYAATATSSLPSGPATMSAPDYDGTGLDWYAFDRDPLPVPTSAGPTAVVRPTPVRFAGMPEPRFWAFERGDVNLDLEAGSQPAYTLLTAFAHAYANDWFLVPLDTPSGVTMVTGLTVTDSFGDQTPVPPAAAVDGPSSPWRLWDLTPTAPSTTDAGAGLRLFLADRPSVLEGPPGEDVLVARDEMANLGWLVELTARDPDGGSVDRTTRWLTLRPATDPSYDPATVAEHYRLGTTLPDHWYPLVSARAADGSAALAQAALPPGACDVDDAGVRGSVVPHVPGSLVADVEASGTGTRVRTVSRLAVTDGVRTVWRARVREPGVGEASSGLRFDVLGGPALAPDLLDNADFALGRRSGPSRPLTQAGRGVPAPADGRWTLWNNAATTTTAWLEATTRPGGVGWAMHVATGAGGCGLTQQWSAAGTGPHAAVAEAWVHVLRGSVALACGNGADTGKGVATTTVGEWVRLTAPSRRSPVNQVTLYAASPDGADFLVDSVSVRPRP